MRLVLLVLLLSLRCTPAAEPVGDLRAQQLVDAAIAAHGGEAYNPARIHFEFRGEPYEIGLDGGRFAFIRTFVTARGDSVRDVLDNSGLRRTVNGNSVALTDSLRRNVTSTVNSVPYFVLLPYRLNDAAVVKAYAGPDTVAGEPYERVAVSFRPEGGGPDFEDRYLFWFHADRHTMDYLAYTFSGGSRFRVAQNVREVEGLRFADYLNLTDSLLVDASDLPSYSARYSAGLLDTVSVVAITGVRVLR